MKNTSNEKVIKIEPKACSVRTNPESSATGETASAVNLRECEQGLVVAGLPSQIAQLSQGEKLLLVDGGHIITTASGNIMCNGTVVCSTNGADAISAHKHGHFISIVTTTRVLHLAQSASGLTALRPHNAVPLINLCETEATTVTCPLSAYTFSSPLTSWQSPLPSEDVACLTKREAQARLSLTSSANAQGRHCGMMLVRYGVRLHDDSYLWLSAPVLLGSGSANGSQFTCSTPLVPMTESSLAINSAFTGLTFTTAEQRYDLTASDFTEPAHGTISVSKPGNPFAMSGKRTHTGLTIISASAAERPLYSGGFGRYPLYIFTTSGIYAMPGTTSSGFGEPRVITDAVVSSSTIPCSGNGSVWFIDAFNRLCRLSGIKTEIIAHDIEAAAMAWDGCHRELAVATPGGSMLTIQPSGRIASRTITATALIGCNTRAYATTADDAVLDLSAETTQSVTASYLSQPVAVQPAPMGARLTQIIWNVCGTVSNAELSVRGERGLSCHGFLVNTTKVNGTLAASLPIKLVSRPLRSFRIAISGTFAPGTLLLPITVTAASTHINY